MARYKLSCFGTPILELDGRPVKLEMRKSLAMLIYLRMTDHDFSRESIAALFWPEYDQCHALANLRRTLSSLNKSLQDELLEADREKIGLKDRSAIWLDVEHFLGLLATANNHAHTNGQDCPECLRLLEEAARLYHGDFMEGFNLGDCAEFTEWQVVHGESLRQELGLVLQKMSEVYASKSLWKSAIDHARRWVGLDRLHEPAQRFLITLYMRADQRSAAQRQYEELVQLLQDELGQKPEDKTVELYQKVFHTSADLQKIDSETLLAGPTPASTLEPVLKTKLYIPFSKGKKVFRERLVSKLNQIEDNILTILSAPAGFGKTTALSEWISQTKLQVGWLSLDSGDNEPVRFLSYIVAALDSMDSVLSISVKDLILSQQFVQIQSILTSLIHNIESSSTPFILILDDYQNITAQQVHEAVAFLINRAPVNMHLVIITRVDPPLPLARLRVKGQLLEIRTNDLRFTLEETREYFDSVVRLNLSSENITTISERTEGWIVGLQMAGLSLQDRSDPTQFIQQFSGSHRYILDYLMEEVLNLQHPKVQEFLVKTSILERLCSSLCACVIKGEEGENGLNSQLPLALASFDSCQQILEYLERANLFVTSLDDQRFWYRYHFLFAQLLQSRLQALFPLEERELQKRAARWYEQQGLLTEAIHHGLSAGDVDWAVDLVERNTLESLVRGTVATTLGWINSLPKKSVYLRPYLCLYKAWALIFSCQPDEVDMLIEQVNNYLCQDVPKTEKTHLTGFTDTVRAFAAGMSGDYYQVIQLSEQALSNLNQVDPNFRRVENFHLRCTTNSILAAGIRMTGDLQREEQALNEARRIAMEFQEHRILVPIVELADLHKKRGQLKRAEELYLEVINMPVDSIIHQETPISDARVGLADLFREQNKLDQAKQYLWESLESYQRLGNPNALAGAYALMVRILLSEGNFAGAMEALRKIDLLEREYRLMPGSMTAYEEAKVWVFLKLGKSKEALQWIEKMGAVIDQPHNVYRERMQIALARLWLAQGKYRQCGTLLNKLAGITQASGRIYRFLEILVLQSRVFQGESDNRLALDRIGTALEIAKPECFMRVFLDEGQAMLDLLVRKQPEIVDHLAGFLQHLLESFKREPSRTGLNGLEETT